MKKILFSLSIIVFVGAIAVGATGAFFSDTETSTGNTFTAGAIDLGIDNSSYLNGAFNEDTSWLLTYDLDDENGPSVVLDENGDPVLDENDNPVYAYLYFNFFDLKPGDWGEDTISIHVNNNPSWACVDVTLTSDDENDVVEPEMDLDDDEIYGELADHVDFIWWVDDGDNVLEEGEELIPSGPLGVLGVGGSATVPLASPDGGIFGDDPLTGAETHYIGKAWCFGEFDYGLPRELQDGAVVIGLDGFPTNGPDVRYAGFTCDGSDEGNITQSDSMTVDISFRAEQARNNDGFSCYNGD